jgi:hypothetical protein
MTGKVGYPLGRSRGRKTGGRLKGDRTCKLNFRLRPGDRQFLKDLGGGVISTGVIICVTEAVIPGENHQGMSGTDKVCVAVDPVTRGKMTLLGGGVLCTGLFCAIDQAKGRGLTSKER